jgi:hypothetical protein
MFARARARVRVVLCVVLCVNVCVDVCMCRYMCVVLPPTDGEADLAASWLSVLGVLLEALSRAPSSFVAHAVQIATGLSPLLLPLMTMSKTQSQTTSETLEPLLGPLSRVVCAMSALACGVSATYLSMLGGPESLNTVACGLASVLHTAAPRPLHRMHLAEYNHMHLAARALCEMLPLAPDVLTARAPMTALLDLLTSKRFCSRGVPRYEGLVTDVANLVAWHFGLCSLCDPLILLQGVLVLLPHY